MRLAPSIAPSIALIVPAHQANGPWTQCVGSLLRLDPAPEQLIVVDDGGPGSGVQAALAPQTQAARWEVLRTAGVCGPAAARNAGARAARAEVLLFLDSDIVAPPDLVERVRRTMASAGAPAALFGSYDRHPSARGLIAPYRNLLHHYTHQNSRRQVSTFWAGCGAVRRRIFEQVGGFDERYRHPSVEDIELGYRLRRAGHEILLCPDLQVTHCKHWSLASLLRDDVLRRARPWTTLLLERRPRTADLNLSRAGALSVAGSYGALVGAAAAWRWPQLAWLPGLLLAAVLALNARFYQFLAQCRGVFFAVRAVPLHLLYFLCAGAGLALGVCDWIRARLGPSGPQP